MLFGHVSQWPLQADNLVDKLDPLSQLDLVLGSSALPEVNWNLLHIFRRADLVGISPLSRSSAPDPVALLFGAV